ncbi:rhomboid family intramembrane serine protease [Aestuariibaculum sp. YM273]|uniref:rhomboid family intramembrane serine protease n=1 Tax=Aestuariibaculum sp. YM273 TaxID=3070659 RepID=UPI0027DD32F1|nr:rhomboid family intramembrane serine protease [Aestuariibaculum sp. YM273]WMI64408.1 rhomboid family intramembrane serine protease [Aestuariibaculum sp. YM273]
MMRISESVKHLIIINVIMFIGTMAIGNGVFYDWFALYFPKNDMFQPWQIVTHMFMHGGISHILFNMFALWMFGTPVEQVLGSKRFLFIYFSAGLGAVLLQLGFYYVEFIPSFNDLMASGLTSDQITQMLQENKVLSSVTNQQLSDLQTIFPVYNGSMVGASGCIMGILAAFGMMNPNAELMMIFLPIPIKAKYFIPGIIILDLVSGLSGNSIFGQGNVAHFAHVGGAVIGFIIMWYWKKNQFNQNRWY